MAEGRSHSISPIPWLIGCLIVGLMFSAVFIRVNDDSGVSESTLVQSTLVQSGEPVASEPTPADADSATRFLTTVRRPHGPPTIQLTQPDPQGRVGKIACSTCHSTRDPDFANRVPTDLDQFHQGMPMVHGTLSCYSCHNPDDADTLRLADTTTVEYADVMTLCAQCHGKQMTDYQHGAHGGMNGYWDLNQGPRTRNNCVDCHDPHVPKFPSMKPTFKPRDRFLDASSGGH